MSNSNMGLPAKAHDKMFRLADQQQQAFVLMHSTVGRISDVEKAIAINPADGDRVRALRRELTTLRTSHQQHQDRHRECADLNASLRRYLERLPPNVDIADAKPVRLKLQDGENYTTAVDRIRREIAGLVSERIQVSQSGPPIEEIKANVRSWIEQRRRLARPLITATHEKFSIRFEGYLDDATAPILDIAAALAWFDPERFGERLDELIDAMPPPRLALTGSDKSERLRSIAKRLYELEQLEEAIIVAAEDEGQVIARRPTADPKAVLGITVRSMAAAA
ncbi:hypothetical protein [Bradyrhizobium viridifuturi]|uniref:hypothetical protein n=1 Tax=Bradyrhizobium viridifuturi TaxID=1654716 RepID=UPI000FE13D5D|nr:hypothetical protein [Bradyrhizobium viridifuturi]